MLCTVVHCCVDRTHNKLKLLFFHCYSTEKLVNCRGVFVCHADSETYIPNLIM